MRWAEEAGSELRLLCAAERTGDPQGWHYLVLPGPCVCATPPHQLLPVTHCVCAARSLPRPPTRTHCSPPQGWSLCWEWMCGSMPSEPALCCHCCGLPACSDLKVDVGLAEEWQSAQGWEGDALCQERASGHISYATSIFSPHPCLQLSAVQERPPRLCVQIVAVVASLLCSWVQADCVPCGAARFDPMPSASLICSCAALLTAALHSCQGKSAHP